jgi:hypothetical protein
MCRMDDAFVSYVDCGANSCVDMQYVRFHL